MERTIKVLVVDDSAVVREILRRGLSRLPDIEVVATAGDAYDARDKIVQLAPDVMTLDIEMPRMRGLDFLKRLIPQYPMPVVMVSALTSPGAQATLEALEYGAVDFALKPTAGGAKLEEMIAGLAEKIRTASRVRVKPLPAMVAAGARRPAHSPVGVGVRDARPGHGAHGRAKARRTSKFDMIAIGASTGGTVALSRIVEMLPGDLPGIVVVQHMPPVFTRMFAERLDHIGPIESKEAAKGDLIRPGTLLVAPGDKHLVVEEGTHGFSANCIDGEKVNGHRPSVEVLFNSVRRAAGARAIAVMLTGMGRDGAIAMKAMRLAGARTLAQDEATSTVFGMPKDAFTCGGAEKLVALDDIAGELIAILEGRR